MHFVRGDKENSNDSFSSVSIFVTVNVFKRIESLARFIIQMEFLKKFSLFRLQKKASPTVQGSVKSPLAIDSDISNIESKWKRINISSISISNNNFFILLQPTTLYWHLDLIQRLIQATKIRIQTLHLVICLAVLVVWDSIHHNVSAFEHWNARHSQMMWKSDFRGVFACDKPPDSFSFRFIHLFALFLLIYLWFLF